MTIAVTGATGPFGRLAIESLLERGVPAGQIVAIGRDQAKLDDLTQLGVTSQRADYGDPASLRTALAGVDRLLFVSGSEVGQRVGQHQAVVDAARAAGVGLVVYTSAPKADTSDMVLAEEHLATERALIDSGVPYVFLRNGWYVENYTAQLPVILEHGLIGAAGDGLISGAARRDLAEAAAAVLTGEDHQNRVYELGGQSFTLAVLAAEIARQSGRDVRYSDLGADAYAKALEEAGLPAPVAAILADSDRAARDGALYVGGNDLEKLLGRPVTPWPEVVRAALATLATLA
jgi:NAD(P)H dehydrogenase (quinone)